MHAEVFAESRSFAIGTYKRPSKSNFHYAPLGPVSVYSEALCARAAFLAPCHPITISIIKFLSALRIWGKGTIYQRRCRQQALPLISHFMTPRVICQINDNAYSLYEVRLNTCPTPPFSEKRCARIETLSHQKNAAFAPCLPRIIRKGGGKLLQRKMDFPLLSNHLQITCFPCSLYVLLNKVGAYQQGGGL